MAERSRTAGGWNQSATTTVHVAIMSSTVEGLSKGQINRAGERLRLWVSDPEAEEGATPEERYETYGTLVAFRTSFQQPLAKVVMGLRSMVKSEMEALPPDDKLPVGQRMKREPQIERKLLRYPDMKLTRMQDIAGCRAIPTGGQPEVERIFTRIRKTGAIRSRGSRTTCANQLRPATARYTSWCSGPATSLRSSCAPPGNTNGRRPWSGPACEGVSTSKRVRAPATYCSTSHLPLTALRSRKLGKHPMKASRANSSNFANRCATTSLEKGRLNAWP